jgi:copper chaperone CopZ
MRGAGFVQVVLALLVVGVVTVLALRYYQSARPPAVGPGAGHPAQAILQQTEFTVEGMESEADAAQVEEALRRLPGVASVRVDTASGRVRVSYNPAQTNPDQLLAAVSQAGFRARR